MNPTRHMVTQLGVVLLAAAAATAGDESTESLQRLPADWDATANELSDLLRFADGGHVRTVADWRQKRARLQRQWFDFFGPRPARVPALRVEVLERVRQPDHERMLVRYFVEEGVRREAYLLVPDEPHAKRPGVVVLHSTSDATIRQPAGLADGPEKHLGLDLVRRGYAVICPENYLWTRGRPRLREAPAELFARQAGWNGMDKMTWDGSRAIDVLVAGDYCDPDRIGCIGHSLGGKEALYLAAFDHRVQAAVSSEGGIGLQFSNWHAPWYLGPRIRSPDFQHENHEVLALVAPRPFLLLAGASADGDRSWAFIERALEVYRLLGQPDHVGWYNHHGGHAIPPDAREQAFAWLDRWLKR